MMIVDKPLVVALTGSAGQIAYALLPSICDGSIFGAHQVKLCGVLFISMIKNNRKLY